MQAFSRQVADWASDYRHYVPSSVQILGDLVMTSTTRFVYCCEGLVDQENMHEFNQEVRSRYLKLVESLIILEGNPIGF